MSPTSYQAAPPRVRFSILSCEKLVAGAGFEPTTFGL
ncbi:hypothetical protein PAU_00596 [Photorhabdus asymbiotica]|uniref:Uncharacterized protein n=1 Tax=Photorhabdus asymbiotica subsp. asymbiotica (strain ATCC 43949 / 3105-77) TaxID=553480 RepID=C7BKK2_PHOAA|nr:hypothetical protein PAU_00596 [Photorhabdus asymbiotica]